MTDPRDRDTDVTNDTTAKADRGAIDWDPGSQVPVASDVVGGVKSVKNFVDDPAGNWNELINLGANVTSLASTAMDIASDPINWLISKGLGFLIDIVQPIQDAIGIVTGNPQRMDEEIAKWQRVGNALGPLAQEIQDTANMGLITWDGKAGQAAKTRLNDFAMGVAATGNDVNQVIMIMNIAKMLMQFAYDFVLSILSTFVEWAILTWIPALAAAIPTFGASTAAAGAATGVEAATATSRTARFIMKVKEILMKLRTAIQKLSKYSLKQAEKPFRRGLDGRFVKVKDGLTPALVRKLRDPKTYFDYTKPGTYSEPAKSVGASTKAGVDYENNPHKSDEQINKDLDPDA